MIRKNYMVDEKDIVRLRKKMPFDSEATLIRACIKAALDLPDNVFMDYCLQAKASPGPKREQKCPVEQRTEKSRL